MSRIQTPPAVHELKNQIDFKTKTNDNEEPDIDFQNILLNSNREQNLKRESRKKGDLSTAKSYESFLDELKEQTAQKTQPKNSLDKNDFLTLFVTQLQHQDPLKPKDGAEMASQLAQFNSLEQMINMNTALKKMSDIRQQENQHNYLKYIGKEVGTGSARGELKNGNLSEINYQLQKPSEIKLKVHDQNDQLVYESTYEGKNAGAHQISWEGTNAKGEKLADGIYEFKLEQKTPEGREQEVSLQTRAKITGIDLKDVEKPFISSIGKLGIKDVQQIYQEKIEKDAPGEKMDIKN